MNAYERTLASLRDVDEDHLTGKLADADYEAERAYWTDQGVAILQALEQMGGNRKSSRAERQASSPPPPPMRPTTLRPRMPKQCSTTRLNGR